MNTTTPSHTARVAVVTGASRGAGKGIALALGAVGLTVYVTGRSQREGDAALPGSVQATADAVTAAIIDPSRPKVFGLSMLRVALCAPTFGFAVSLTVTGVFSGSDNWDFERENVPSLPWSDSQ